MVYEDETVVVWMDLKPVTLGHVLVVPREHAAGLEDLNAATGTHVWAVGHDMARALRSSSLGCAGINVLVCDGEAAAFQTVFHFHLHVIPRYPGDGLGQPFKGDVEPRERERSLRDQGRASDQSRPRVNGLTSPPPMPQVERSCRVR